MTHRKAFTLVEMMIYLIIVALLGASVLAALWFFLGSSHQMDEYAEMDMEIERAVQILTREFALIGLGMPNNRQGEGSFANGFTENSILKYFGTGGADGKWGGPVTVSLATTNDRPRNPSGASGSVPPVVYVGPELYYAWAVPVPDGTGGAKARISIASGGGPRPVVESDTELELTFDTDAPLEALQNLRWDSRAVGLQVPSANSTRGWVVLPTLRMPLRVDRIDTANRKLEVTVAPAGGGKLTRPLLELDNVHLVQAARLFLRDGSVFRRPLGGYADEQLTLNVNVLRLHFAYDTEERLMSMFIAMRGRGEPIYNKTGHIIYPNWLPADMHLTADELAHHVVTKTLTWRIRN